MSAIKQYNTTFYLYLLDKNMNFKLKLIAVAVATAGLTACGGSSNSTPAPTPAPAPAPTNSAPTAITLSKTTVMENETGAEVGKLTATDPDSNQTFTFEIEGDAGIFVLDGDTVKVAAGKSANYELAKEHSVQFKVTDQGNLSFSRNIVIKVEDVADTYAFASKAMADKSSVSYNGQTARHALIAELNHYISRDTGLKADGATQTKAQVLAALNTYFDPTSDQYANNFSLNFLPSAQQKFIANVSSSLKTLKGKIAGNDAKRMHKNWNDGTSFVGSWTGGETPEKLVTDVFFEQLATNATSSSVRQNPFDSSKNLPAYVNTDGTDLKQLTQKFLLMSVAFSQGTDDYLDEGLDGDNIAYSKCSGACTGLEHGYDEGFGYFGAARNYLDYSDDEIAGKGGRADWAKGYQDTNNDNAIDLESEYNFGASVNAAKRDRGSKDNSSPTDFTHEAMKAFIAGRKIIGDKSGQALSNDELTALKAQAGIAVAAWEKAIAATVIHYINDLTKDLKAERTADSFLKLAKHFSEMKGFALGLQFNPKSPVTAAQFKDVHDKMGLKPELDAAKVDAYLAGLAEARTTLQTAYGFNAENVEKW